MNEWANSAGKAVGREFAIGIALEAMTITAACIPLDTDPLTGLSPIAQYVTFIDTFHTRIMLATGRGTMYDPVLNQLCTDGRMLCDTLSCHHADFFCMWHRQFTTLHTDEPRAVNFTSGASTRLFIRTDECAVYFIDPNTEVMTPIAAVSQLPTDMRFHLACISPDAGRIYWGSREGPVVVVDPSNGECNVLGSLSQGKGSRVSAFSHNNTHACPDRCEYCDYVQHIHWRGPSHFRRTRKTSLTRSICYSLAAFQAY